MKLKFSVIMVIIFISFSTYGDNQNLIQSTVDIRTVNDDFINKNSDKLYYLSSVDGCPVDNEWLNSVSVIKFKQSRISLVSIDARVPKENIWVLLNLHCKIDNGILLYHVNLDVMRSINGKNRVVDFGYNHFGIYELNTLRSMTTMVIDVFIGDYIATNFEHTK